MEDLKVGGFDDVITFSSINRGNRPLSVRYQIMLDDIKVSPSNITQHTELMQEIFGASKEKLVFDNGDLFFAHEDERLTNFGAIVLGVEHQHEIEAVHYEVELFVFSQHEDPKIAKVDSLELKSSTWIEKLGVPYRYNDIFSIRNAIKRMTEFAPVTRVYNYSGWATDKPDTYILDGEELNGNELPDRNKAIEACSHTLKMLDVAEHSITFPLIAIALLSLVQSIMVSLGEYFKGVICLLAQSQSGKTIISGLFFDIRHGRKPDVNFDSTEAAIVRIIGNKRDSVCIVDDLKPPSTANMKKTLLSKIEKITRISADDSGGYQRAGRQNDTISSWSSCITVITAEEVLINVYSTLARIFIILMSKLCVDFDQFKYFLARHHVYRDFIKNYIRCIAAQGAAKYCENLKNRFINERDLFRNKLRIHNIKIDNRTNDMALWLSISFSELLKYVLNVGAICQNQFEALMKESESLFLELIVEQAERINEQDDITRFFNGLRVMLDTKESKLESLQARNSSFATADSKGAIGFSKKGFVYLKNDVAYQAVTAYFRRNGKEFAIAESTLRRLLSDNGYLIPYNSKSSIHRLHVNRETYQCIKFDTTTFNKLKGGNNNDEYESDERESDGEFSDDWLMRKSASNFIG